MKCAKILNFELIREPVQISVQRKMASRSLKYYYDLLSQPSRALYILLEQSKIPYEKCPVALRKLENRTDEFKENVSRFGKVPCVIHGDFKLAENVAIVRYLSREFPELPDFWYPKENLARARVDEYLEWQHTAIRAQCAQFFLYTWITPLLGLELDQAKVDRLRKNMADGLDLFQRIWLNGGKQPYVTGDRLTYADVVAACEIEQPKCAGYDPREGRPALAEWMERVRLETNPFYDQAHKILYRFTPKEIATPTVE